MGQLSTIILVLSLFANATFIMLAGIFFLDTDAKPTAVTAISDRSKTIAALTPGATDAARPSAASRPVDAEITTKQVTTKDESSSILLSNASADDSAALYAPRPPRYTGNLLITGGLVSPVGDPLPGIDVTICAAGSPPDTLPFDHTTSDDAGMFKFRGLAAGRYRIKIAKTDIYLSETAIASAGASGVTIRGGNTLEVYITGRVQTVDRDPIPYAAVRSDNHPEVVHSDRDGRFRIRLATDKAPTRQLHFSAKDFHATEKRYDTSTWQHVDEVYSEVILVPASNPKDKLSVDAGK